MKEQLGMGRTEPESTDESAVQSLDMKARMSSDLG
jgi:hypothetical protein